jgi:hypothetical protein
MWRRPGSNRRPPACKAGALPAELRPHADERRSSRCGDGRGPFWIRTRDLTVISRALSPTELKARGAHQRSNCAGAGTPHDRPPRQTIARDARIEALTPEAWRDLSALDDEDLGAGTTVAPAICCADSHCPLVCLLLGRRTGIRTPTPLHPGTSSRVTSLLFAVPRRALLHDLS